MQCRQSNILKLDTLNLRFVAAQMLENHHLSIVSLNEKILREPALNLGKHENYYLIETDQSPFYFVDLPGYGFAKASQKDREKWGQFIENYLLKRDECQLIIQVIDLRHPPTKDDVAMYQWLKYFNKPVQIVATKADKISKGQFQKQKDQIRKALDLSAEDEIILFSAETGLGVEQIDALLTPFLS